MISQRGGQDVSEYAAAFKQSNNVRGDSQKQSQQLFWSHLHVRFSDQFKDTQLHHVAERWHVKKCALDATC
jgi:hypothetical protein